MKNFWLFVKAEQDQPFIFKLVAATDVERGIFTDARSPVGVILWDHYCGCAVSLSRLC